MEQGGRLILKMLIMKYAQTHQNVEKFVPEHSRRVPTINSKVYVCNL